MALKAIEEYGVVSDDFLHMWAFAADLATTLDDTAAEQRLLDVVDEASVTVPLGLRAHRARAGGLIALRDGASGDGSRDAATASQDAEGQLRQAVALYTEWGALPYRARALAELGFVLAREGRDTEAQPLLDEARQYLTSVGARTWLDELDLALVETH